MENTLEIVYNDNNIIIEKLIDNVLLVRGYAEGRAYPQEYVWVKVLVITSNIAFVKGMLSRVEHKRSLQQARGLRNYLKSIGCEYMKYTRIKDGKEIEVLTKL